MDDSHGLLALEAPDGDARVGEGDGRVGVRDVDDHIVCSTGECVGAPVQLVGPGGTISTTVPGDDRELDAGFELLEIGEDEAARLTPSLLGWSGQRIAFAPVL